MNLKSVFFYAWKTWKNPGILLEVLVDTLILEIGFKRGKMR